MRFLLLVLLMLVNKGMCAFYTVKCAIFTSKYNQMHLAARLLPNPLDCLEELTALPEPPSCIKGKKKRREREGRKRGEWKISGEGKGRERGGNGDQYTESYGPLIKLVAKFCISL